MRTFGVFLLIFIFVGAFIFISPFVRFGNEAIEVGFEEFGPREMLRKYEWFKDAAAQLDKKRADIKVYETRLKGVEAGYEGVARRDWAREDREQYNLWMSEVAGVRASYNTLAATYNAQMAKFNWRFTNAGQLPKGTTEPLPREYKPYTQGREE